MSRWKVWAALRRPKGILVNSKRPKGEIMAVLKNIRGGDRNLIITFHQIQFGKNRGAMETSRHIMKIGERITVRTV